MLAMIHEPFHFLKGFLFVFETGAEDADSVDIVFEVYGLGIFDEDDLTFGTEVPLFDLPYHIPFALFLCRRGIRICKPKNAHLNLPAMVDCYFLR